MHIKVLSALPLLALLIGCSGPIKTSPPDPWNAIVEAGKITWTKQSTALPLLKTEVVLCSDLTCFRVYRSYSWPRGTDTRCPAKASGEEFKGDAEGVHIAQICEDGSRVRKLNKVTFDDTMMAHAIDDFERRVERPSTTAESYKFMMRVLTDFYTNLGR